MIEEQLDEIWLDQFVNDVVKRTGYEKQTVLDYLAYNCALQMEAPATVHYFESHLELGVINELYHSAEELDWMMAAFTAMEVYKWNFK